MRIAVINQRLGRSPQRWLGPGDVLTSYIEGIGEMSHRFVPGRS
jgi:2-keto-4-pentenoate hydratase/2-oxohepta-3-ene-1,7-dioic acid hydratase in catechol pathway